MADSNQDINELKVKSDSLPDNWLVTLVNPVRGATAENMTVARLIELLQTKLPEATWSSKGLQYPYQGINIITIDPGKTYTTENVPYGCYLIVNQTKFGSSCIIDNAFGVDYYHLVYVGEGFSNNINTQNSLSVYKENNGQSFSIKNNYDTQVIIRINRL